MDRKQLIKKYLDFFKTKNHKEIENSSLVPENDPSVLFTTSGMHPLVPFLLGQTHPQGKLLCNVQRCVRTGDIEEVGNRRHHTCFEMLGNWSLGNYWKKEAIELSFEFATKILGFSIERIAVTVFAGNKNAPRDNEAAKIWESLGIKKERIVFLDDNWWGPAGNTGPCGPDTELFYWMPNNKPTPKVFNPEDEENWVEIWNDVLMQYNKDEKGIYAEASQKNIDNGRGLERVLSVINKVDDNYLTEIWQPIIRIIEKLSGKSYLGNEKEMRIIADHTKAAVFIIADGVVPGNVEQGYVLRRLIRRAIRHGNSLGINNFVSNVAEPVFLIYNDYEILKKNKRSILAELEKEEERFNLTLEKGLRKFRKFSDNKKIISGKDCFLLFQSYGFPIEITKELAEERGIKIDKNGYEKEYEKHQKLSRTATVGKFKSGLADDSVATTKLHTAAHLLLQALRDVLKDDNIIQKGSNITSERLRLDFSFPRKLTEEEVKGVEDLINAQIQQSTEIIREEMSPKKAKEQGALGIFDSKYGDVVSVYTIGDFSKEICTGPHVKNLSELGTFKIQKQKSVGEGSRRIKAVLE